MLADAALTTVLIVNIIDRPPASRALPLCLRCTASAREHDGESSDGDRRMLAQVPPHIARPDYAEDGMPKARDSDSMGMPHWSSWSRG